MKLLSIIRIFLVVSLVLLIIGMFAEKETMKLSVLGIMSLTMVSFYLTWVQPTYLSRKTVLTNLAIATYYAFLVLSILAGLVLFIDAFVTPVPNISFAIFSSIFVSTIVARMYVVQEVSEYL